MDILFNSTDGPDESHVKKRMEIENNSGIINAVGFGIRRSKISLNKVNNNNKLSMRMGMIGGSREVFNFCLESRGSCHCICYHLGEKKKSRKELEGQY